MTTATLPARYVARGTTDEITECEHCGKTGLKHTVRMAILDADGNEDEEIYMGATCAAKMSGRPVKDIRTEAARADRERAQAIRDGWRAWQDAHHNAFIAWRDSHVGERATAPDVRVWWDANREAIDAWRVAYEAAHPKPVERPPGY